MTQTGRTLAAYGDKAATPARGIAGLPDPLPKPRLGFLGVGWIGRQRMEMLAASRLVEIVSLVDPSAEMRAAALEAVPGTAVADSLDDLLADRSLDGLVIATPSALHAEQAIRALDAGLAVFCQKPLGRTAAEVEAVVDSARRADRLLAVDLSYRFVEAFRRVRDVVAAGEIGRVFAAELVFHNAYGPDKSWFYDPTLAGGGCVMDLGVHLVDTALWVLGFPAVVRADSRLFAGGEALGRRDRVEDYATVRLDLDGGITAQIACSWNLPAGQDAVIGATFYGVDGGVSVRNVGGSFYDFIAERFHGTTRQLLASSSGDWCGRAAVDWAQRLSEGARYDPGIERLIEVATTLDAIYRRAEKGASRRPARSK